MFKKLYQDSRNSEKVDRDWGYFVVLDTVKDKEDLIHRQKLLVVKPRTTMQLHMHTNYTEMWIGENRFDYVVEDNKGQLRKKTAEPFERVFVPKNRKHQIISRDEELKIFEVQTGLIIDDDNIKFD